MNHLDVDFPAKSFDIQLDSKNLLVHLTFNGMVGLKDFADSFSAIIRHPEFVKNMHCCYDLSNAEVEMNLNDTEICFHFTSALRDKRGSNYVLVFVCNDELTKMMVNFYRLFLVQTKVDVRIEKDFEKALQWIQLFS